MSKILVCDDDRDIVSALRIYLEAEGYEVLAAYNGKDALALLRKDSEVALLILDIMMPELDGISTLAALREERNLPVILLTAKTRTPTKFWDSTSARTTM